MRLIEALKGLFEPLKSLFGISIGPYLPIPTYNY